MLIQLSPPPLNAEPPLSASRDMSVAPQEKNKIIYDFIEQKFDIPNG